MAGFAVQYWYYGQIDAIGRTGKANTELTVLKATQETMALQKQLTRWIGSAIQRLRFLILLLSLISFRKRVDMQMTHGWSIGIGKKSHQNKVDI